MPRAKEGKAKPKKAKVYKFTIAKRFPRTKSYVVLKQFGMNAFDVFGKTVSRIMGGGK